MKSASRSNRRTRSSPIRAIESQRAPFGSTHRCDHGPARWDCPVARHSKRTSIMAESHRWSSGSGVRLWITSDDQR
ncbi:MAG: hypothetical protein DMF96_06700 [Acidobacteria bacterium]|nr:MAG: hypothetical protein DMF96_06700 [Acidobacteriota bacterium]